MKYPIVLSTSIIIACAFPSFAQEDDKRSTVRSAADLKTGNSQDVLVSFFQLAFNDLNDKKKRSFNFESSLIALVAKHDPSLWQSEAYLKNTFLRNFNLGISPAIDSTLKFKSFGASFKYAIVNRRDKTVYDFVLKNEDAWRAVRLGALGKYAAKLGGVTGSDYKLAADFFDVGENVRTKVGDLPEDFKTILEAEIASSAAYQDYSVRDFQVHLFDQYADLSRIVENRPLWTIGSDLTFKHAGLSDYSFNSEFLRGLVNNNSRMNVELDIAASFDVTDDETSETKDLDRRIFSYAAGFNWIVVKDKSHKPRIEFKGSIKDDMILEGKYADEETSTLTANGTLRLRLTNELWIPVTITYDPEKGKFLGFLTVKSNFDFLK
jgi:hypothetical protein